MRDALVILRGGQAFYAVFGLIVYIWGIIELKTK